MKFDSFESSLSRKGVSFVYSDLFLLEAQHKTKRVHRDMSGAISVRLHPSRMSLWPMIKEMRVY